MEADSAECVDPGVLVGVPPLPVVGLPQLPGLQLVGCLDPWMVSLTIVVEEVRPGVSEISAPTG